jgi:two-component system heavy metal sensor histidine kinase CusS
VCVGCSQLYVSRDMATIDRLVLSVGLVVLLLSPLVGHLLTSRTIRPLAQMIRTTARLHPGEVGERLPIRGTGDELDSLAHTINGLLDRIASYLQQEHDFLANAAHDLRTPLAAIQSSVEVALGVSRTDEEYREILGLVIEQCSSLQTLVNQLLLLAETDTDRLQIDEDPVPLHQVVARVVEMFEGVADDHRIDLRVSELQPVAVPGNRHHLRQVVSNLLDNAIKFTAARGSGEGCDPTDTKRVGYVTVELVRDDTAHCARLVVRDNGIGIASEDAPKIFDRFFRADKARVRNGVAGGTGLGLSICKAIVDAHGGEIAVESQPGEGSTFTVSLPLYRPSLMSLPEDEDPFMELP